MRSHTTGPFERSTILKINSVEVFPLPFTVFEPSGAVFIMNSKIHLRKNSLNEYFKTISHYFRVYSLSGLIFMEAMLLMRKLHSGLLNYVTTAVLERIEWVKHTRLLGVTIDDRLSCLHHLTDLKKEFCKQTEPPEKEFFLEQKRPIELVLQDNITISSIWTGLLGRLP